MPAYLDADALPVVIHFPNAEAADVAEAAQRWLKESMVLTLSASWDALETATEVAAAEALGYGLVNFGALALLRVTTTKPEAPKPVAIIEVDDVDDL